MEVLKAMISQPMNSKTDKEIESVRKRAISTLAAMGYEVVNSYFKEEFKAATDTKNIPLTFLAKSIETMSKVDLVFFCEGWENARGCCIEFEIAKAYGLDIAYSKEED